MGMPPGNEMDTLRTDYGILTDGFADAADQHPGHALSQGAAGARSHPRRSSPSRPRAPSDADERRALAHAHRFDIVERDALR